MFQIGAKHRWMVLRAVIVGEVVAFLASFRVWHKMNTSRDYRKWMNDNYPSVLEGFYKTAEMGGYVGVRELDYEMWSQK